MQAKYCLESLEDKITSTLKLKVLVPLVYDVYISTTHGFVSNIAAAGITVSVDLGLFRLLNPQRPTLAPEKHEHWYHFWAVRSSAHDSFRHGEAHDFRELFRSPRKSAPSPL